MIFYGKIPINTFKKHALHGVGLLYQMFYFFHFKRGGVIMKRFSLVLGIICLIVLGTITNVIASGPYAYVTNDADSTVSVIDASKKSVVKTIQLPVNAKKPYGIAVSPDGAKAYVANYGSGNVSVINTRTFSIITSIRVGQVPYDTPWDIAVNPSGTKAYVTHGIWGAVPGSVSVIDTSTFSVTTTIKVGHSPEGIAVNAARSEAYVANCYGNDVSVIDMDTNAALPTTISAVTVPHSVAVSRDGKWAYVTDGGTADGNGNWIYGKNVTVINTSTHAVDKTLMVGTNSDPYGVAVSPDGGTIWVTDDSQNSVSVIDTSTNSPSVIKVGQNPLGIAFTPDGKYVYVVNNNWTDNSVSVIETSTKTVVDHIKVGSRPIGIAFGINPGTPPGPGETGKPSITAAAIDPMRLILGEKWYLIWVQIHHPDAPFEAKVGEVLRKMNSKERAAAVARAKVFDDYYKAIKRVADKMK
jgi:YVTN family beta-propeller protein